MRRSIITFEKKRFAILSDELHHKGATAANAKVAATLGVENCLGLARVGTGLHHGSCFLEVVVVRRLLIMAAPQFCNLAGKPVLLPDEIQTVFVLPSTWNGHRPQRSNTAHELLLDLF